jgi:hypothetical protein
MQLIWRAIALWLLTVAAQPVAPSFAQGADSSQNQQQFTNEVIDESVNTTMLFATQDIFSTGTFTKFREEQPDTRYNTIRAPFEVGLGEKTDRWNPYIYGSGALLHVSSGTAKPPDATGEDDFSTSKLFALATGFGTYLRVSDDFRLAASAALTFSHLNNRYDFNNSYSQRVLEPDSSLYYNFDLNLFTYAPTMRAIYESRWGERTVNYTLGYSQLFNNSLSSSSPAVSINSASGILWNRFAVTEPTGLSIANNPSSVRPFFQWSNINGKAASGLALSNIFEVGADLVVDFKEKLLYFSQMYWGGSYVTGDNFEGYHLGFGGKF